MMAAAVVRGAVWAVVLAFPLATICALLYRFPVPFAGYATGPEEMLEALVAAVFYGILGGFPALAVAGALSGATAYYIGEPDAKRVRRLAFFFATMVAALGVGGLAILEEIIGPW
jgi:hypothetical protein